MQTASTSVHDEPASDADLARRIGAGDQQAFTLLMRRYNRLLYRTARSVLKNDTDAEDALQDAYLQVFRNIGAFRGDARLGTWLTRIVLNEAIARSRKIARRAEVIELAPAALDDTGESRMDDRPENQPEQQASRAEMRALLEKKIDRLPDAFRTVFMLRALEEMSVEEVASALSIPEATVRSRFFRARGMLRESINREVDVAFEEAFSFDGARCDRIVERTLFRLSEQS